MMHTPILSAPLATSIEPGFPGSIDQLAEQADQRRPFLRSAWYRAAANCAGQTLIGRRPDGAVVAAIPLTRMGPDLIGAKGVPGSYWPYRSVMLSPDLNHEELVSLLASPEATGALAPLWRVGPAPESDHTTQLVMQASAAAGWTVLVRHLGDTWLFDLAGAAQASGASWPRNSTQKRLRGYERQLSERGEISWHHVCGDDWNNSVLNQLGAIEAASWVGMKTDGSGAKFLTADQRLKWERALADPVIAQALSATLLCLDQRPIAFSFDLRSGDRQYAIAGSYAEDMAHYRVGKMVTYRQLQRALVQGVHQVDLGSGDGGYKREMGAKRGAALIDILIVRHRSAARLLARQWGQEPQHLRALAKASPYRADLPLPSLKNIAAAAAIAGAAVAAAE